MALVAVKNKYQIVIPRDVREAVGVEVGDLLEAKVEGGKITFTPKSVVDRGIAESLADFAAGRSFGPFKTQKELISSLHRGRSKNLSKTKVKRKLRG
jgi:AbrB family looped-hinge helix DNA binding protein